MNIQVTVFWLLFRIVMLQDTIVLEDHIASILFQGEVGGTSPYSVTAENTMTCLYFDEIFYLLILI